MKIADGSGEIVARAGGQIIPVIRDSSTDPRSAFLAFSLFNCLSLTSPASSHFASLQGCGPSDDADEHVYIMARRLLRPVRRGEQEAQREREGMLCTSVYPSVCVCIYMYYDACMYMLKKERRRDRGTVRVECVCANERHDVAGR